MIGVATATFEIPIVINKAALAVIPISRLRAFGFFVMNSPRLSERSGIRSYITQIVLTGYKELKLIVDDHYVYPDEKVVVCISAM